MKNGVNISLLTAFEENVKKALHVEDSSTMLWINAGSSPNWHEAIT